MQKVVAHVALFRFGVHKFQNDVNYYLENGWELQDLSIEKHFFKIVMYAVLFKASGDK